MTQNEATSQRVRHPTAGIKYCNPTATHKSPHEDGWRAVSMTMARRHPGVLSRKTRMFLAPSGWQSVLPVSWLIIVCRTVGKLFVTDDCIVAPH